MILVCWTGFRCDNGLEYISDTLQNWAGKHGFALHFIQPEKPQQNAYVERYNRTVRHKWLEMHEFNTIEHAQEEAIKLQ
ncbi:MAG: transposase family protein [Alphaproteobacteria bacterium]|nr:transposase family protein [Alphaproteobacteria bacterium]